MDETTSYVANGLSEKVSEILTNGYLDVAQMAQDGVLVALPIGLGIVGLVAGIRISINFFRSLAHA